ncbi:glycosyltransferase [Robiginitalea sp. IMCC44478]|uniref:glycosyltransferase n=1 Tax=Robiginitalea sp. IMCC44478 TaxID=3459122 RepID=UPI004041305E
MKPFLSIVIPVYNVEDYVEKCIRSCYDQELPISDFEVIVVNDGTNDSSLEICEYLQNEFPTLKIISQENKGLSGARNTGLQHATGEYVWFVDSDDWIKSNCLNPLITLLKSTSPDLLWMGHCVVKDGKVIKYYIPQYLKTPVKGNEFYANHLEGLYYIWKFIYSRKFLLENNLKFYEGLIYEDLEFTPRALNVAESCITLPESFYYYLIREGSIVNKMQQRNINARFLIIENHLKLYSAASNSEIFKRAILQTCLESFIGTVKMAARSGIPLPKFTATLWHSLKAEERNSNINYSYNKLMKINLSLYHKVYHILFRTYKAFFR